MTAIARPATIAAVALLLVAVPFANAAACGTAVSLFGGQGPSHLPQRLARAKGTPRTGDRYVRVASARLAIPVGFSVPVEKGVAANAASRSVASTLLPLGALLCVADACSSD